VEKQNKSYLMKKFAWFFNQ